MSARSDVGLLPSGRAARRLKVDPWTVVRWAASGRLLSVRTPGGHYRLFAAEVDALARGESRERARGLGLAEQARLLQGQED